MTETRSYAPAPARHVETGEPVWKALLVGVLVVLSAPAAAMAGFFALITWSGCFLSCSGSNHTGGALLGLLAVALLASGPGLAALLYRRWSAVGWSVLGLVGSIVTSGALLFG